eukprot:g41.t1
MDDLVGHVAVITGGSGGIGRASAEMWLAQGGSVICADIDDAKGEAFASEHPGRVRFVHCDTRRKEDLLAAIRAAEDMGRFSCMFNNAGVGSLQDNVEEALDHWETMLKVDDINIRACCLGTLLALKHFSPEHGGAVVTTASMAGLLPTGAPPMYSMSKAANVHFTRAVASALGEESNVRVHALCPSYTATNMGPDPEQIQAMLGGVLTARHQAEGFMMLATERGELPNGSVLRVTARQRGRAVVHDLVAYGRELGGPEKPRPGRVLKEAPLEEYTGPMEMEGRLDVSKL